jgi:kinesin family protein 15
MTFLALLSFLQLREDVKRGMHVENLTEHEVSNAREAMQQLIEVSVQKMA